MLLYYIMGQIQYLLGAIVLIVLDGIYLNIIKQHFIKQIKAVQGSDIKVNFIAAILTYVFLIFGLNYFIIRKRLPVKDAMLFGLVIYATYELTNMALLKNWSWITVILDTAWGSILFGLTTAIVYKLT
jgi:uncharacterized membrane protein